MSPPVLRPGGGSFNNWTRIYDDPCNYKNSEKIGAQPIKYYVNNLNTPQSKPFQSLTAVGNIKTYVRNEHERPKPSRLNPISETYITPYPTTPFLATQYENRTHTNTGSELRFGSDLRGSKSSYGLSEIDYNRWEPGVDAHTVQNAGQFGSNGRVQSNITQEALKQNNVVFANGAFNRTGISSRNELHNFIELNNC